LDIEKRGGVGFARPGTATSGAALTFLTVRKVRGGLAAGPDVGADVDEDEEDDGREDDVEGETDEDEDEEDVVETAGESDKDEAEKDESTDEKVGEVGVLLSGRLHRKLKRATEAHNESEFHEKTNPRQSKKYYYYE